MTTQLFQVAQRDQRSQFHPLVADGVEAETADEILAGTMPGPAQVARMIDVMAWAKNAAIAGQSPTLNGCCSRGIFL